MRIGVLYDAGSGEWDPKDVASVQNSVREVQGALRHAGYETGRIPVALDDAKWLRRVQRFDLIFNLCEGVNGLAKYEDYVVAALDLARIPYTGCPSWPVTIAHRKHIANTLLAANGIPVPPFALSLGGSIPAHLQFPVIVKPSGEDASVGIDADAICTTRKALRQRLEHVNLNWDEVLVQEYVPGREVNVGFIGSQILPMAEIEFRNLPDGMWPILTYAAKWDVGSAEDLATVPRCPAKLEPDLRKRVGQIARAAWELLCGAMGYGRVDIRISPEGRPYVLEVNPNPDISDDAGLSRMARASGWSYDTLICKVVDEALDRFKTRRVQETQYLKIPA